MNFEKYLEEVFMRDYHGDKDHWESLLDAWLSNLDRQELIDYADLWGETLKSKLV